MLIEKWLPVTGSHFGIMDMPSFYIQGNEENDSVCSFYG